MKILIFSNRKDFRPLKDEIVYGMGIDKMIRLEKILYSSGHIRIMGVNHSETDLLDIEVIRCNEGARGYKSRFILYDGWFSNEEMRLMERCLIDTRVDVVEKEVTLAPLSELESIIRRECYKQKD